MSLERAIGFVIPRKSLLREFVDFKQGKMRAGVRAVTNADPFGTGISPISRHVKAQSLGRTVDLAPEPTRPIAGEALMLSIRK